MQHGVIGDKFKGGETSADFCLQKLIARFVDIERGRKSLAETLGLQAKVFARKFDG